jgi:hypothetical protein
MQAWRVLRDIASCIKVGYEFLLISDHLERVLQNTRTLLRSEECRPGNVNDSQLSLRAKNSYLCSDHDEWSTL